MELVLKKELFENDEYTVQYGSREIKFIIIDEEFLGNNRLGRINRIVILANIPGSGDTEMMLCTGIIGLGTAGVVGIHSEYPELRGKPLTHENMDRCVIELYEVV